jgi:hypothetical protein
MKRLKEDEEGEAFTRQDPSRDMQLMTKHRDPLVGAVHLTDLTEFFYNMDQQDGLVDGSEADAMLDSADLNVSDQQDHSQETHCSLDRMPASDDPL